MNPKPLFECHITIQPEDDASHIERIIESKGWSFSSIQNDPDLGKARFCYATRWFHTQDQAIGETIVMKDFLVSEQELSVVRMKVEQVVFDARLVAGAWRNMP